MTIIETLINGYPKGDVSPQDFIDTLSIGAPGWIGAWISVGLAVIFGLLVYVFPVIMTENEHTQPYPLWLHTFYWAADFMGIWVFLHAWTHYDHFLLFILLAIGEAIWVCMETYCLQRAMKYEKEMIWGKDATKKKMLTDIIMQIVIFYVGLNMLRFELHDSTMWKFWIFTQVLITIVPGLVLEQRGYRSGNARILNITFICVALVSFNPWLNMWKCIAPDFFSFSANPWYYLMGIICLFFAIRGAVIYERLPEKTDLMGSGKSAILK
ncbi:MAG: ABC transporter permease [Clostridia bacterium]|nr:ABC transporter permease [Clostridia bacterium]